MKIRKFNENTIGPKPKGVDTEYIDMCFVDFLDAGAKTKYDKETGKLYRIKIKLREKHESWEPHNIKDYIKFAKKLEQITLQVEDCLNKVKIEYPDIDYSVFLESKNDKFVVVFVVNGPLLP
jgi:hypothetical protein